MLLRAQTKRVVNSNPRKVLQPKTNVEPIKKKEEIVEKVVEIEKNIHVVETEKDITFSEKIEEEFLNDEVKSTIYNFKKNSGKKSTKLK